MATRLCSRARWRPSCRFEVPVRPQRLALGLVVVCAGLVPRAHALPDIETSIEQVSVATGQTVSDGDFAEGCAGGQTNRTLIRFGVRFSNVGPDPLVLGDPGCPDCELNPGAICTDPRYECSPADGHNHPHFRNFARYELLDPSGAVLAEGGKRTFCARDFQCDPGVDFVYTCDFQGISAGCNDLYMPTLGCQYIDATAVPDVTTRALRIRVIYDPDRVLLDADRTNDVFDHLVPGCGDGVDVYVLPVLAHGRTKGTSRVFSGCSIRPNLAKRLGSTSSTRRASVSFWNTITKSSA